MKNEAAELGPVRLGGAGHGEAGFGRAGQGFFSINSKERNT